MRSNLFLPISSDPSRAPFAKRPAFILFPSAQSESYPFSKHSSRTSLRAMKSLSRPHERMSRPGEIIDGVYDWGSLLTHRALTLDSHVRMRPSIDVPPAHISARPDCTAGVKNTALPFSYSSSGLWETLLKSATPLLLLSFLHTASCHEAGSGVRINLFHPVLDSGGYVLYFLKLESGVRSLCSEDWTFHK
ncbi:hypothetical protein AcV5_008268 [Taiwanofungus camphoratus]|nr:hypothetical protein AcV5_008268 [Antrodia cinnamomea]